MKKLAALLCALLLLAVSACAYADEAFAFNFRNGVKWDMTMDEVKALEGAADVENNDASTGLGGLMYASVTVSRYDAQLIYLFNDDMLKLAMYGIADTPQDTYDYLNKAIASLYGAPQDVDPMRIVQAVSTIQHDPSVDATYLEGYTASSIWQLEDGTLIFMGLFEGDTEIIYINGNYEASFDLTGL